MVISLYKVILNFRIQGTETILEYYSNSLTERNSNARTYRENKNANYLIDKVCGWSGTIADGINLSNFVRWLLVVLIDYSSYFGCCRCRALLWQQTFTFMYGNDWWRNTIRFWIQLAVVVIVTLALWWRWRRRWRRCLADCYCSWCCFNRCLRWTITTTNTTTCFTNWTSRRRQFLWRWFFRNPITTFTIGRVGHFCGGWSNWLRWCRLLIIHFWLACCWTIVRWCRRRWRSSTLIVLLILSFIITTIAMVVVVIIIRTVALGRWIGLKEEKEKYI